MQRGEYQNLFSCCLISYHFIISLLFSLLLQVCIDIVVVTIFYQRYVNYSSNIWLAAFSHGVGLSSPGHAVTSHNPQASVYTQEEKKFEKMSRNANGSDTWGVTVGLCAVSEPVQIAQRTSQNVRCHAKSSTVEPDTDALTAQ